MYNLKAQLIVVEIPRTGATSLKTAVNDKYRGVNSFFHGPKTLKELTTDLQGLRNSDVPVALPLIALAVVRNPVDRLVSLVNAFVAKYPNNDLDEVMRLVWGQKIAYFRPQSEFVQLPTGGDSYVDLRMWDMSRIHQAIQYATRDDVEYHKNKATKKRYTLDDIIDHKLYDDMMETTFKPDLVLWVRATQTDRDGKEAR